MTETRAVSIEDVRMLVAERQRYDDWLAALDARRTETPDRVFERVRGDYSGRRSAVLEQLRGHVTTLAALGDELDAKLSAVDSGLSTLEDERAEAMLRTAVGEFDGERWETVRQQVEAKIAEVSAERTELQAEVGEVRALLASARSEPAGAPSSPEAGGHDGLSALSPEADSLYRREAAATDDHGGDEVLPIAAAMPVALEAQSSPGSDSDRGQRPGSTSAETEEAELDDALALFTPTRSEPTPPHATRLDLDGIEAIEEPAIGRSSGARTATLSPSAPVSHPAAAPVSPPASAPVPAAADADPFDDLAFLRSVTDPKADPAGASGRGGAPTAGTEPQKTLRCTECGTMNLPTEWYCERCGGELAAF